MVGRKKTVDGLNRKQSIRIAANTMYTIGGALILNGVLQLLVYPQLAAVLGAEANGTVLYLMAIVNILGPSAGQALNNSRLVQRRKMDVTNGDYDLTLLLFSGIGVICAFVFSVLSSPGAITPVNGLPLAVLIFLTVFRYYGDVEYRLNLNYRRYFVYYCACGAGYAAGFLIFKMTGSWIWIFLAGDALALCFVGLTGGIFRDFFGKSVFFRPVMKSGAVLVLSYFVTNLTLNIDRIFLKNALGGEAVTVYYVVSLIGRTLVLFIAPVNTVIISYLTREKEVIGRKRFIRFAGIGLLACAFFFVFCRIATPVFIRLFYPDLLEACLPLVAVASLSQILAMYSAYLFIIVLTFTGEKWQLALQVLHLVILLILITAMTPTGGLKAFAAAVLAANAIRILMVVCLGLSGEAAEKPEA